MHSSPDQYDRDRFDARSGCAQDTKVKRSVTLQNSPGAWIVQPDHKPHYERVSVGKVPFEVTDLTQATGRVLTLVRDHNPLPIRLANAYCVATASKDHTYLRLLNDVGLNFPDGTPVVWFMRSRARTSKPSRVRGPSLFREVLDKGQQSGISHFFLGTTPSTLTALQNEVKRMYPLANIRGTLSPAFGPLSDKFYSEAVSAIERASPDIVWVALGSPKQDFAAVEICKRTNVTCIGVGAAFDFVAGTANEAPEWIQANGIEWLFRLATDPKRLWRRYIFGNITFLRTALTNRR
ncbi:WecB/TagA/CpsF family glycosyltransferase [Rhodococcus ruber]|uniref:WecB/TagA/CpsF family glycosyltransferase n=1 Tax=Rhodococcus ruber TaxID=1830 RepID=A0ABT4MAR1_9NOCA|nr:WecB/TagA/CpsF family glycosyltransferase [Rhodococcus ruber]MCZ4518049.1 WecB/TagA/CpsF family glycosyltransferase [Rhodococcus ruber]